MSFELTFSFHPFILVGRGNTIWAKSHWQDIIVDNTMNSFLAQNYTCTISHHRIIPIHIYKPQFTNQKHTKLSTSYKLHNLTFFFFFFLMGIQAKYHTRHNKRKELNSLDLTFFTDLVDCRCYQWFTTQTQSYFNFNRWSCMAHISWACLLIMCMERTWEHRPPRSSKWSCRTLSSAFFTNRKKRKWVWECYQLY